MAKNLKRNHSSDLDDFSEEGTSGSDYSPDGSDSDNYKTSPLVKRTKRATNPKPPTNTKTKNECNYKENCYRKNPVHFRDLSHPHLEKILAGYTGTGDFVIPPDLQFQEDIIKQQLQIIKTYGIYSTSAAVNKKTKPMDADEDQANGQSTSKTEVKRKVAVVQAVKVKSKDEPEAAGTSKRSNVEKQAAPQTLAKIETNPQRINAEANPQRTIKETNSQHTNKGTNSQQSNSVKRKIEDFFNVVAPKGKMKEKHEKAAPFYMFFTTITSAPETHSQPLSITFQELLDPSLGKLQSSLQINFMVDIGWLLAQYYFAGYSDKPLTILYGEDMPDLREINQKRSTVSAHLVPMKNAFGKHHTKMGIYHYDDESVRIVISTANLYIDDWENRTQGLWLSPRCPRLADPLDVVNGDSPTGFKRSLINYLNSYSMPSLSSFIKIVKNIDFSSINVFFVASIPGGHFDSQWGLNCIGNLLSKHCVIPENETSQWDLIAQASSIGSYGNDPKLWLCGDFQDNLCRSHKKSPMATKRPGLKFIYPSLTNVKNSHDNLLGGGCLPYANSVHVKQQWLVNYLQEWSAVHSGRNRAMPHIKSYLRLSPDAKKAAFFLLTSANISKSAWGTFNKGNRALRINSYEVGVLFLPKFIMDKEHFSIELDDPNRLPIPYDLPPIPYETGEVPWVMDYLH